MLLGVVGQVGPGMCNMKGVLIAPWEEAVLGGYGASHCNQHR